MLVSMAHAASRVPDFALLDHNGTFHQLSYYGDQDAVVILAHALADEHVAAASSRLDELVSNHADNAVVFFKLNVAADARDDIAAASGSGVPVLVDAAQLVAENLGFKKRSEAVVIDPQTMSFVYRGAVNDKLAAALDRVISGSNDVAASEQGGVAATAADIAYPELAGESVSYTRDIVPILADNCVSCHHQGGIGPWAMTDYNMVRGFSLMIREVVRTKRMPPWHADPAHGTFSNDRSLAPEETQKLVHWIEAGAPRGDGPDPLAELDIEWPAWDG